MILPKEVDFILEKLNSNNYKAYAVGGCCRDVLMKKKPKDWDIATSAHPDDVKSIFNKTFDTGIKHGTITVMVNGNGYEVTTFRLDGEYTDFRRPSSVDFTPYIEQDLMRRDFTINAIAYNHEEGFIDPYGGVLDIQRKIIKGVGDARKRFNEDALRMMRAIRFSGTLGFTIEPYTQDAIISNAHLIKNISAERIKEELSKIILSSNFRVLFSNIAGSLFNYILPQMKYIWDHDIEANKMISQISEAPSNLEIRMAVFLHCQSDFKEILKQLKFSNAEINVIKTLVNNSSENNIPMGDYEIKKMVSSIGLNNFYLYLDFIKAILNNNEKQLASIDDISPTLKRILAYGECIFLKDLKIDGNDLINIGISQGVKIKEILNYLHDVVLKDANKNDREVLLALAGMNE